MKNKVGSVEIYIFSLAVIAMFIILAVTFLLYIQIDTNIYNVKTDLFYITQNAFLAIDFNELMYANYIVDESILKMKIIELIRLNYPNLSFTVNEISYDELTNKVLIDINIRFNPVVLNNIIGDVNIRIKDKIKLKLMEVQ